MVKEIQVRTNLIEEKKSEILLHKASRKLGIDANRDCGRKSASKIY